MDVKYLKSSVRKSIWSLLETKGAALPPKPIYGRIPNFKGADVAARRLRDLSEYVNASVVKVSPDSPQYWVRYYALQDGKMVLMPTPRLRGGFIALDPAEVSPKLFGKAATIRGAFEFGKPISIHDLVKVDFIVTGSVAVTLNGARLGKGGGYSEYEYGILRELNIINDEVRVATTVHDLQLVQEIPREPHDLSVDYIATPTRLIKVEGARPKPKGIMWEIVTEQTLKRVPLLEEVFKLKQQPSKAQK